MTSPSAETSPGMCATHGDVATCHDSDEPETDDDVDDDDDVNVEAEDEE